MEFTKESFKQFRVDLDKALAGVAEKYELDIVAGNISYDTYKFNIKLEASKTNINGSSAKKVIFIKNCKYYGLEPDDFERSFFHRDEEYKLIGIRTNARRNIFELRNVRNNELSACDILFLKAMTKDEAN